MHPAVLQLGRFSLGSYGLLLALSFIAGTWLALVRAKRRGLDPGRVVDAAFWIVVGAMVGARIHYFILHIKQYGGDPLGFFIPLRGAGCGGGMAMFGGILGGTLACALYFKLKRFPILPYADAIAPSLAAGMFLTRVGCFLNGCCFGLPTAAWFGVRFPLQCPAGRYQVAAGAQKLIPSQLLLSLGGLLIAVAVLAWRRKRARPGFIFYLTLLLISVLSFVVDFTRYYPADERIMFLSHNQVVSLVLAVAFGTLLGRSMAPKKMAGAGPGRVKEDRSLP